MATLATHFTAFLFLIPIGTRRFLFTSSLHLKNPNLFSSKPYHFSNPKSKNFDLYALLIFLPIALISQIFFFFALTGHPVFQFTFLQQSVIVLVFWLLSVLIISRETFDLFPIPDKFVFVFASISFLIDYSMNGKGVIGLGGAAYKLLGQLSLVCSGCCLYLSVKPFAFFVEFLFSTAIVMKGTWALLVGLLLYTDSFRPKGCREFSISTLPGKNDLNCELDEDRLRGISVVNLVFVVHFVLVLMASFGLFGLLCRFPSLRVGEGNKPLLAELESETMLMRPLPELEIE